MKNNGRWMKKMNKIISGLFFRMVIILSFTNRNLFTCVLLRNIYSKFKGVQENLNNQ